MRRAAMHRLLYSGVVVLAVMGASGEARAKTAIVATRLDYVAAPGCPNAARFEAVVIGRLGYDPFRADAPDRVTVRIEPAGKTLEGRLEWHDPSEADHRGAGVSVPHGDCDELTRAMGFALALQVQLMAATVGRDASARRPPRPPPGAGAPRPRRPHDAPTQVETTGPEHHASTRVRTAPPCWWARARRQGSAWRLIRSRSAVCSRPSRGHRWRSSSAGEAIAPSTTHRADGAGFSQEEFLASLAGCGVHSAWSLCAVGKIGELRVAGQGVDVPLTASGFVIQAGLRLTASHTFGHRTYIVGRVEGLGRVTQGTVTLDSMPVWTTPRFAALLGIDVAYRFR